MHYYKIIGYGSCPWCQRANSLLLQEKLPLLHAGLKILGLLLVIIKLFMI